MNEQIKDLMLEAGYAAPEIAGRANLLAELVIKKSAKFMDEYADRTGRDLLEHFGVKK
jgi:hypothetical protein